MRATAGFVKLDEFIVPDEFSFTFRYNGSRANCTYTERGSFFSDEDARRFESSRRSFLSREGLPETSFSTEVNGKQFTVKIETDEKREVAISRIFNEILFQMKCHFSDDEIHRMVDEIVVTEVTEGDSSSPGADSLSPGVTFYLDPFSIDGSRGRIHLDSLVGVVPGLSALNNGTKVISGIGVPNSFSAVDNSPDGVLSPGFSVPSHIYHEFRDKCDKNVLRVHNNGLLGKASGGFLLALQSSSVLFLNAILWIPASAVNALLGWMYTGPIWHFILAELAMGAGLLTIVLLLYREQILRIWSRVSTTGFRGLRWRQR